MYWSFALLLLITALYAGYNILIKFSTEAMPDSATSTIFATIALQASALAASCVFLFSLLIRGGHDLTLPAATFGWAIVAGLCIGAAEIGYFYLLRGVGGNAPMLANSAIPTIVGGTIVITVLISWLILREPTSGLRLLGAGLVIAGVIAMFAANGSANN